MIFYNIFIDFSIFPKFSNNRKLQNPVKTNPLKDDTPLIKIQIKTTEKPYLCRNTRQFLQSASDRHGWCCRTKSTPTSSKPLSLRLSSHPHPKPAFRCDIEVMATKNDNKITQITVKIDVFL